MKLFTSQFLGLTAAPRERTCTECLLSFTLRFSGVWKRVGYRNRFSGFHRSLETASPGYFTPCQVAQAFQPAVSQVFNLHCFGGFGQSADWKSAIQQAKSLRYAARMLTRVRGVKYADEAVQQSSASNLTPLKRGVNETRLISTRAVGQVLGLVSALGLFSSQLSLHAQNDATDVVSNAVVEAAASIVSNAIVQFSEAVSTNDIGTNDLAQASANAAETNIVDTNNLPGSPQPGPLESRRQWLMRQRAGIPVTNDSGNPNQRSRTNAATDSIFRPVKPEFSAFKLVTDRNIFDPNRAPRRGPSNQPPAKIVDSFALVGVMSYEKGTFAFFDGSSSEYKRAVKVNDTVAGYKITSIEPNSVNLLGGTNHVELRVGMQLRRQDGGDWVPSSQSEVYASTATSSSSAHSDSSGNSADNDILERLRKKREQE